MQLIFSLDILFQKLFLQEKEIIQLIRKVVSIHFFHLKKFIVAKWRMKVKGNHGV